MVGLEHIVGLTQSDCDCYNFTGDFEALNASQSGRYLTDADGGFPMLEALSASIDCNSPGNVLDLLTEARTAASRRLTTDVSLALAPRYHAPAGFRGTIGQPVVKPVQNLPGDAVFAGIEIVLPVQRGASLVITHVHTAFPSGGGLTLLVASSDYTHEQAPIALPAGTAGGFTRHELPEPLILPCHSPAFASQPYVIYRLYYQLSELPYGNKFTCCGVATDFNGHFTATGFTDDGTQLSHPVKIGTSARAMGLVLEGRRVCDTTGWLAEAKDLSGYQANDLIAQALVYAGAIHLIHAVLAQSWR